MKKILIVLAVLLVSQANLIAQSTDYEVFKVDAGCLYGIPSDDAFDGGIGVYLEPKYNVTNNIAVGLRLEWVLMAGAEIDEFGENENKTSGITQIDVTTLSSYIVTADYYVGNKKVRPFIGLGAGLYSLGEMGYDVREIDGTEEEPEDIANIDYGTKFGFAPRAGLLIGHFRLGCEYNMIAGIDSKLPEKNYLSIKMGIEFGGSKK